jgi:hypothetical protein
MVYSQNDAVVGSWVVTSRYAEHPVIYYLSSIKNYKIEFYGNNGDVQYDLNTGSL